MEGSDVHSSGKPKSDRQTASHPTSQAPGTTDELETVLTQDGTFLSLRNWVVPGKAPCLLLHQASEGSARRTHNAKCMKDRGCDLKRRQPCNPRRAKTALLSGARMKDSCCDN